MNFSRRSYQKELLDGDGIPFADIKQNMKELEFINRHLGGHRITLKGFRKLLGEQKEVTVCEIGCGGGDNLKAIARWCESRNITARFVGIDINKDCVVYAGENCASVKDIIFIHSDYQQVFFDDQMPDIIFSSLFCHHLDERELQEMWQWCEKHAGTGFFINDLHRHPWAYYAIKILTLLFSKSYLVKNDAPLSVRRGFKKKELMVFSKELSFFTLTWQWAFRWLLVAKHAERPSI